MNNLRNWAVGVASVAGLLLAAGYGSAGSYASDALLWHRPRHRPASAGTASLNNKVLSYAQGELHQKVGGGQCWDLVDSALRAAGADTSGDARCVFGTAVDLGAVAPGDCLQFEGVSFKHTNADGSWYTCSYPHHSAIVASVSGRNVTILNQNVGGVMTVQYSTFNLDDRLPGGTIQAYRPK